MSQNDQKTPTGAVSIPKGRSTAASHPTTLRPPTQKPKAPQIKGNAKPTDSSASASRPCPEHSFLTDVDDVRQVEEGLLQLLDDFHTGKLQAFGGDGTFEKMDQIREQQERLARMHFELDTLHDVQHGVDSMEDRNAANKGLHKLMDNLQELCSSIHTLQKDQKI